MHQLLNISNLHNRLAAAALAVVSMAMTSCTFIFEDIEPGFEAQCELTVNLRFNVDESIYDTVKFSHSRGDDAEDSDDSRAADDARNADEARNTDSRATTDVQRYVINAFPVGDDGEIDSSECIRYVVDATGTGFKEVVPVQIIVPFNRYHICVWADYANDDFTDLYYDTTTLTGISVYSEYAGNNNHRLAYEGSTEVNLVNDQYDEGNFKRTVDVDLQSPLARFEIISDDLEGFIDEMARRHGITTQSVDDGDDGSRSDDDGSRSDDARGDDARGDGRSFDADIYKIRVRYMGFSPSVFNVADHRVLDSTTGVSFLSSLKPIDRTSALLGYDYVFVTGNESGLYVTLDLYETDSDGEIIDYIGSSASMLIPTARGRITMVYGSFLTTTSDGSITINPDYDGTYYVPLY